MRPRQERKLTREEFEKITSEIQTLAGDKLRNHRDGDAERPTFKGLFKTRRTNSRTNS